MSETPRSPEGSPQEATSRAADGPERFSRRRQLLEGLCAASARALADDPALHFTNGRLFRGYRPLPAHAPHLRMAAEHRDLASLRAVADAQALRLRHSDAALFARLAPEPPVERLVFELLEQLRVESLAPESMPGMAVNIRHRFEQWSLGFFGAGLADTEMGMLLFTVLQMVWSRLNAYPVVEPVEDFIEPTRAGVGPQLGSALAGLRRHRDDQSRYAGYALEVAQVMGDSVAGLDDEGEPAQALGARAAFAFLLDFEEELPADLPRAPAARSREAGEAAAGYKVFTKQYDTVSDATEGIRAAALREYRERLDRQVAEQGYSRFRLARLLSAALLRPVHDGRLDGQEEGRLDAARLARLVAAPTDRHIFFQEQISLLPASTVTFLIDCSGSMKDQVSVVAPLVDILLRALDALQVETEVLGFTTGAWNGGRAYKAWLSRGRPAGPGRLNELAHRVFKKPGQSWRQARPGIAGLYKADRYREGIDGEAVLWALQRLMEREAERRLLVVISDGCPADAATLLTNGELYLDEHLRYVIRQVERSGIAEIMGIGVGLDLSSYYRRNVALDLQDGLKNEALYDVARMMAPAR